MLSQYFLSPVALVELNFQESAKPEVSNAVVISLTCCSWCSIIQIRYNEALIHLGAKSQPVLLSGWIRNVYSCSNEKSDLLSIKRSHTREEELAIGSHLCSPTGWPAPRSDGPQYCPTLKGQLDPSSGRDGWAPCTAWRRIWLQVDLSSPMSVDLQSPWLVRGVGCCSIRRAVNLGL